MKKRSSAIILALALVLALALTACGKSEAAQKVDDLINAIGEVTLDSGSAISDAEKALSALDDKDQKQVEGAGKLTDARAAYDELVRQEEERKLQEQADKVIDAINAIGTVTLDSGDAITAARTAYDKAKSDVQARVTNLSALEKAETDYAAAVLAEKVRVVEDAINAIDPVTLDSGPAIQQAWNVYNSAEAEVQSAVSNLSALQAAEETLSDLRAGQVIDAINSIGTVTANSSDAITAARSAYKALSSADKAKVTNLDVLEKAENDLKTAKVTAAEATLRGMWKQEDKVRGLTFYYPSNIPHGSEYWYYDQRSFVLPYLSRNGNRMSMWLIYCYTGSSWVFFEDITVVADGERFTDSFNYFDVDRDTSGSKVCENAETSVGHGGYYYKMLQAMAAADEVIVRFEGDDHYRDITISSADKKAIKSMLDAFDAFHDL